MYRKADDLIKKADQLFTLKAPVLRMWQAIANNFYPMRADFDAVATAHHATMEPADWLADSYPVLCHRDLSNSIDSMLRDGDWFEMTAGQGEELPQDSLLWLDQATRRQRAMMGVRESGFSRAVKQGDMDYAAFGQCVISVGLRRDLRGLLYRNHHLRDCAWFDDEAGNIGGFVRAWRPTREEVLQTFGFNNPAIHKSIMEGYAKDPFHREEFLHLELPAHMFQDIDNDRFPFVSFFVDRGHNCIIEQVGIPSLSYIVPRFLTLAESPYAYSPATMAALPDARTLQAMTFTLLEAAERHSNPPLVAQYDVVVGEVDLSPNGITYVDNDYDERNGQALRPLLTDKSGYPIGQNERSRVVQTLTSAFYLDRINIPVKEQEQTAYEFAEMMKQYRRQNLPLFQPIEVEYNGQICEKSFDTLMRGRFFGPLFEIPEKLQGTSVQFRYKSPLSSAAEQTRAAKFGQIQQLLTQSIDLDGRLAHVVDLPTAMRSAVKGIDVPPDWLNSEKQYQAAVEADAQQAQAEQAMMAAQQLQQMATAA